jgi:Gpi18-like mannosyltransferase
MLGLSMLVKHQGVFFVLPVVACLWDQRLDSRLVKCLGWTAAVVGAGVAPFLILGDPIAFILAMRVNVQGGMLSGDALNVWWIVTAAEMVRESGAHALDLPMQARQIWWTQWGVVEILRAVTGVLVGAIAVWATLRVRKVDSLPGAAALGAFVIHAYFVLSVGVHENHLVYAVPLAGIVVLYWRDYWPIFLGLSAMVTINLLLFYGLGRDFDRPVRTGLFLPLTVVLSAINIGLLATHLRTFLAHTAAHAPIAE